MVATEPSDAHLLDRWRAGDRDAGKELFNRYYDALERFFANKVSSGIGDMVHETFCHCIEAKERIEDPGKFRSYLFSIALNVFRGMVRKQKRHGHEIDFDEVSLEAITPGPRSILIEHEEQRLLLEALRAIPINDQSILELFYWESLRVVEIAEVLQIPRGTVQRRLHDARKRLKRALRQLAMSPEILDSTMADLEDWARQCRHQLGRIHTS